MPRLRAAVFDFFGTLTHAVDRGPWHAAIARHLGCDPEALTAVLDRSFYTRSRGVLGTPEATLRWVCVQLGVDPSSGQLRAALRARLAAIRADTVLRADAIATLRQARLRGARTAVISDCGYELPAILPSLPIAPLLDTAVYSVEVGHCKPHPVIYHEACQRLGVDPRECLYVGDGGSNELTGAAALGMTAVRLAAPDLGRHLVFMTDDYAGPAVDSLSGVLDFLPPAAVPRWRRCHRPPRRGRHEGARRFTLVQPLRRRLRAAAAG